MTLDQQRRAKQRCEIRPEKVKEAIIWLKNNHYEWENIDLSNIEEEILAAKPSVLNMLEEVDSGGDKVLENSDTFSVYFPDGSLTNVYGGHDSSEQFNKIVELAQARGFTGEVISNLTKTFVRDYEDNNFTMSCLLQMPYGRGGPEETRYNTAYELDNSWTLDTYEEHI